MQSARKSTGGENGTVDDFLGFIEIPVKVTVWSFSSAITLSVLVIALFVLIPGFSEHSLCS